MKVFLTIALLLAPSLATAQDFNQKLTALEQIVATETRDAAELAVMDMAKLNPATTAQVNRLMGSLIQIYNNQQAEVMVRAEAASTIFEVANTPFFRSNHDPGERAQVVDAYYNFLDTCLAEAVFEIDNNVLARRIMEGIEQRIELRVGRFETRPNDLIPTEEQQKLVEMVVRYTIRSPQDEFLDRLYGHEAAKLLNRLAASGNSRLAVAGIAPIMESENGRRKEAFGKSLKVDLFRNAIELGLLDLNKLALKAENAGVFMAACAAP